MTHTHIFCMKIIIENCTANNDKKQIMLEKKNRIRFFMLCSCDVRATPNVECISFGDGIFISRKCLFSFFFIQLPFSSGLPLFFVECLSTHFGYVDADYSVFFFFFSFSLSAAVRERSFWFVPTFVRYIHYMHLCICSLAAITEDFNYKNMFSIQSKAMLKHKLQEIE